MRQALAGGAWVSTAAGVLLAFALFAPRGSSDSRLFWIGLAALGAATLVLTLRPPRLSPPTVAFLGLLVAFALWQAVTIAWSIQPASSWDYANRTLVYLGFAAVGVVVGSTIPRTWVSDVPETITKKSVASLRPRRSSTTGWRPLRSSAAAAAKAMGRGSSAGWGSSGNQPGPFP